MESFGFPVRSTIVKHSKMLKHLSRVNYNGCDLTCVDDKGLDFKESALQHQEHK